MTVGCSFGVNTRYTIGVVEVETESNSILKPVQEIDDEMMRWTMKKRGRQLWLWQIRMAKDGEILLLNWPYIEPL